MLPTSVGQALKLKLKWLKLVPMKAKYNIVMKLFMNWIYLPEFRSVGNNPDALNASSSLKDDGN